MFPNVCLPSDLSPIKSFLQNGLSLRFLATQWNDDDKVLNRLDYWNFILSGLPLSALAPLLRAQNTAAQIVLGLSLQDYVRPVLRELNWLPITYCIKLNISMLMYLAHRHHCPSYMSRSYHLSATIPSVSGSAHLMAPTTTYHAWTLSGPSHWNSLPESVCAIIERQSFKKILKNLDFHNRGLNARCSICTV